MDSLMILRSFLKGSLPLHYWKWCSGFLRILDIIWEVQNWLVLPFRFFGIVHFGWWIMLLFILYRFYYYYQRSFEYASTCFFYRPYELRTKYAHSVRKLITFSMCTCKILFSLKKRIYKFTTGWLIFLITVHSI